MLNSSLRAYEQAVADTVAYQTKLEAAQKALNEQTGAVIVGAVSRQKAVESAVKRMAATGLTGFTDAAGRNWSAQAYVQMDIRTTAANAARQAVMDRNEAHGNNLIAVSSHPGARPLCAPYQGKVFSTDGTTGTVEDLNGRGVDYVPLSSTSYGQPAGLFGINCGHLPSPFVPGVSVVRAAQYSPKENAAAYEQTQQQRYMERKVRRLKTQADALEAAGDAEGAKALRGKARQATADLIGWCSANGRDFYPERVRVLNAGEAKTSANTLKIPSEDGILKVNTGGKRNEEALTQEQIRKCNEYAISIGMPAESIVFRDNMFTSYLAFGDRLYIGTDVYPAKNGSHANSHISYKGAIAHEIVGHRAAALKGTTQPIDILEEAQASIRASKFAPGLTDLEKNDLWQDARERLASAGIDIDRVIDQLDVWEE